MQRHVWGSVLWAVSVQYFVVQVIVALAYTGQYSLAHNTISDLGNTVCGLYGQRYVCSPLHSFMNASFITLGITQLLGAMLLLRSAPPFKGMLAGYYCMAATGLGTILVGIFPENSVGLLHAGGAALPFVLGNVAMVLLSRQPGNPGWYRWYSLFSGGVGLLALVLFVSHIYLGIGLGGMERLIAYPQTIWMIAVGTLYLHKALRHHTGPS